MKDVRVFQIDDYDWWIGRCTTEEMIQAVVEEHGCDAEELDVRPLTNDELDTLRYHLNQGHDIDDVTWRTFREQMEIEVANGLDKPRLFASTET